MNPLLRRLFFWAFFCLNIYQNEVKALEIGDKLVHPSPVFITTNPCPKYTLINSVEYHPKKNLFCIACTHGNQVVLYKKSRSGKVKIVQTLCNPVACLSEPQHAIFSPDGKKIVVANWTNQTLAIYEEKKNGLFSKKPTTIISPPQALSGHKPHGITISPCGNFLAVAYGASSNYARAIALYLLPKKREKAKLLSALTSDLMGIPKGITFSPDGKSLLVTFSDANSIAIFDFDKQQRIITHSPRQIIQGQETQIFRPEDIKISPDKLFCVVSNSEQNTLTFYPFNADTNSITHSVPCAILKNPEAKLCFPHGIAFSNDGAHLLVTQFGHIQVTEEGGIAWDNALQADESKVNIYTVTSMPLSKTKKSEKGCFQCGVKPYPTHYKTPAPITHSSKVWSFVSEPRLHPMKIKVTRHKKGTSSGFLFLAPYGFSSTSMYGQPGSLMMDNKGEPVWFRALKSPNLMNTDFRVQQLWGKPVLTFWQGTLATPPAYVNTPGGSSEPGSCYYILDNSYKVIRTLSAKRGYISDIHEFLLTPQNTALFLSTKAIPMDLRPYGGPKHGYVQNFAIQEVDVKTKKLLFFWSALDHIPLEDSHVSASSATMSANIWDAYHLNSIGLTQDKDDIIVSSRSTWALYKINKPTKKIVWTLGGKQSDFKIEKKARFSWQHDARLLAHNIVSLFDDNSSGSEAHEPPSHGLELKLNFKKMKATLHRAYYHNPNISVASQGNLESLSNGNKFVGWGQSAYFSEYKNGGNTKRNPSHNLLYEAQMPGSNNYSYRAYRHDWVGTPHHAPSLVVKNKKGHVLAYASWNGSTETVGWKLFSGPHPHKLSFVTSSAKLGFETVLQSTRKGPYFQVKAINKQGKVIGKSSVIRLKHF